jgi:hypothetical protein
MKQVDIVQEIIVAKTNNNCRKQEPRKVAGFFVYKRNPHIVG